MLLKDPAFRAAYEAESQNPQSGYQIIRHHGDGTEEVVFDSRVSGTDLPTNWMNRPSGRSLTADRHLILIRLEKRMILNHCR